MTLARDDLSWIYDPKKPVWTDAEMFRWSGEIPFGQPPWNTLEEREIPLLREATRRTTTDYGNRNRDDGAGLANDRKYRLAMDRQRGE